MDALVFVETTDRVATITLNRPEKRNALNVALLTGLRTAIKAADEDDGTDAVILTGADPAFCAGLDLKELGSTGDNVKLGAAPGNDGVWSPTAKPIIGAINGVAVTGGLELALQCDLLIASDRAAFADTHARVGVMPSWGLSVLLPQAVGLRVAKRMSLTGNFVSAAEALQYGLVTEVVRHEELLARAQRLAADIVANDQASVRELLASYRRIADTTTRAGLEIEAETARSWLKRAFDPGEVAKRRDAVISRGRGQTSGPQG